MIVNTAFLPLALRRSEWLASSAPQEGIFYVYTSFMRIEESQSEPGIKS
jgi:hypothetical protein